MLECPLCHAKFPNEATFCWSDGSKLEAVNDLSQADSAEEDGATTDKVSIAVESDPLVLEAKEQATMARRAMEEAIVCAEQAHQAAQEAARLARHTAEQEAQRAQAALEDAKREAQERLEIAQKAELEHKAIQAEIAEAKSVEAQARAQAERAREEKLNEQHTANKADALAREAQELAALAQAEQEAAAEAARRATERSQNAQNKAKRVQEEAKLAAQSKARAEREEQAAKEAVLSEIEATQTLERAALEKALLEQEARNAAKQALALVEEAQNGILGEDQPSPAEARHSNPVAPQVVPPARTALKTAEAIPRPNTKVEFERLEEKAEDPDPMAQSLDEPVPTHSQKETASSLVPAPAPGIHWEGQSVGHYQILKRLGGGFTGDVYLAQDVNEGARVALKMLHPRTCAQPKNVGKFLQEIEKASSLDHRGIIHIHETVHDLDTPSFYVMDALNGAPLSTHIPKEKTACFDVAIQLASALAAAHEHGLFHGQLTLECTYLLATPRGQARVAVMDFGIHHLIPMAEEASRSQDLQSFGTMLEAIFSQFATMPDEFKRLVDACKNSTAGEQPKNTLDVVKTLRWIQAQKKDQPVAPSENPAMATPDSQLGEFADCDAEDEFEIRQWKRNRSKNRRRAVFSALTCVVAVGALAYATQIRWDNALQDLRFHLSESVDEQTSEATGEVSRADPPVIRAAKNIKVQRAALSPAPIKRKPRPVPVKMSRAKPAPVVKKVATKAVSEKAKVAHSSNQVKPPSPPAVPLRVVFQSDPAGAKVRREVDQRVVGVTPFTLLLPSDATPVSYQFSLPGYLSTSKSWDPKKSSRVLATMQATPRKKQVTKPAASVSPAPRSTHEDLVDPFAQEG